MTSPISVSDPEMADRSRLTIGRAGSNATVEGPSNRPARSPWTSRARAWATSRPSSRSCASSSPRRARAGRSSASTTSGQDRRR